MTKRNNLWKIVRNAAIAAALCGSVFYGGCGGPLDKALRQSLNTEFVGKTYLAKTYLGSQYTLAYTNNLVDGRSTTGVFIDSTYEPWYETDASFFDLNDRATFGKRYTLEKLQRIDLDINHDSFAQGIQAGQVVTVTKIDDKKDQVVFEVMFHPTHTDVVVFCLRVVDDNGCSGLFWNQLES